METTIENEYEKYLASLSEEEWKRFEEEQAEYEKKYQKDYEDFCKQCDEQTAYELKHI